MAIKNIREETFSSPGSLRYRFISGWINTLRPGTCPFHRHAGFEIVYHKTGRGKICTGDGRTIDFAQGSWIIHPPGQTHSQTMHTAGEDICIHVGVDGDLPDDFCSMHYLEKLDDRCLAADLAFLAEPRPGMNDLQKAVFDHRGAALLLTLFELSRQRYDSAESHNLADRYAGSACRIIYNEFSTIRQTREIAAAIGISQHYLRHIFKARYGTGIKEFLINVRLERAGDLLINSTLPLKAIADSCGFASERHLCTVFKKQRGVSPGVFRTIAQK